MPIILNHGWPWTFWDMQKLIGPLSDPAAHGGDATDAFDVVVPSLPGYGFSTPLAATGINFWNTADLWVTLMQDQLGYDRFASYGGDWGALITARRQSTFRRRRERLFGAAGNQAADPRLRLERFADRTLRLDAGEAPQLERLRWPGGIRVQQGRAVDGDDAVLGQRKRRQRRPLLL
jgi:pimeloyl-ACP methyl ester carboxylesterase